AALMYALIVNSNLSIVTVFLIFFMTVVSTAFNLIFATKYKILLQSENKEYVLNSIQVCTLILGQFLILLTIYFNGHMLLVRFSTMLASLINSFIIIRITKKRYPYINFNEDPDFEAIKGTNDVFI